MGWRCRNLTARRSQHGRAIAERAPDSLVDLRTGEPEPTFGVDVFVPRNCTVEDLEVELTAKHLMVKVAGWGVFRRHWVYTCRSDEASWHLVDECVEINQ